MQQFDPSQLNWEERTEQLWLVRDAGEAYVSKAAADKATGGMEHAEQITLYRPTLAPIYGGPTLLEALWSEMDRLMEALMTGVVSEDGGDRFRAEELAWVIAIVTNAYSPSMDNVRAEAMRRWEADQADIAKDIADREGL